MRTTLCAALTCAAFAAALARPRVAAAHGFAGDRFFPPTISTDDPFAVDELAFPTVSYVKNAGSPSSHEIDAGFEFDKEIFPHFSLGVSDTYIYQNFGQGPSVHGWDNLTILAKYQVYLNPQREFILSIGLEADIGGTGSASVGADSVTTLTPTLYYGKGFGDLPDSVWTLRPFAVTGTIGQSFPTRGADANTLEWGFALEYSLPYLMGNVRDVGIPRPFRDVIPLVEFAMSTDENRGSKGLTSGTINPGVLYEDPYFQLGVEANIPVNSRSGAHVGVTVQIWIFIDDIFPHTFGHPLFGERA
jgi:hypothetical protein